MALSPVLSSAPNFVIDQGLEYYAGKTELLDWINHLLALNLTRLEQLTSGAVYCQIVDAFYADIVAIRKVNFFAREEYEILPNYKVLQAAFNALGLTKELNVAKLSQASPPDLMEFAQWLYKSFKGANKLPGYNPNMRRQQSVKGGTVNVPLPACVVNSAFEFTRIDMRSSGNWGGQTPPGQEGSRSAVKAHRSLGTTPGTGGSNKSRRTPPYVNVASRYKEGLTVPPEHYERRSPRLSPGSSGGALRRRILVGHHSTQTDFPEEDYRPMTAADVGTEVAPERRDYGQQYEDVLCYSPSESMVSPSPSEVFSHGLGSENFSFGRSRLGTTSAPGVPLSPRTTMSPTSSAQGDEAWAGGRRGPADAPWRDGAYGDKSHGGAHSDGGLIGSLARREALAAAGDLPQQGPESAMPNAFARATAAASFAIIGDAGGMGLLRDGSASPREAKQSDEPLESSVDAAASEAEVSTGAEDPGQAAGREAIADTVEGGGVLTPREREQVASPAVTSSTAPGSAAASPSPRTCHRWRHSPAVLPPDVAALLASPVARTRLASQSCLRDMATALDVCAAALQAADKSLGSYATLLDEAAAPPPEANAAAPAGAAAAGDPTCSPVLCGKTRSLHDALQTLLEHTALLLNDVQTYSQATHTQEQQQQPPRSPSASPRLALEGAMSPGRLSPAAAATGQTSPGNSAVLAAARNFLTEAAALLECTRSYENRLVEISRRTDEVLQLRRDEADPSVGTPHRHLTDEQRKLCSTTQLDNHLKAVGMAQFALVQDVHRELAAQTATYFRHTGITSGGGGGGGEGSIGGGGGSVGGVSTSSSRKARVFKLGEYQLKQLRNGDIYKGRYVCNKKNGEGVYHFINADVYEGEFRDDRMDGYGVYTFSHEGRYEGQWRNAVYNGTGAETFAKGSTYHGEYTGGLRNGWGVCRFYNGDYYEGQWSKGLRDGTGMQQCTDDSNFVGDYQRGKRHGHGVYSFPNGDRYEGQYFEDLPHGQGTYHFASGQCYQGQWQHGKKHGWSVYTVDNGNRFMGLWSEGKPTWVQPLNGDAASSASEDSNRALQQALEARDFAVQAAAEARKRAANHWEVAGAVQSRLQAALRQAQTSASLAQQARRKACDLAARLDAAVALLRTQGAGVPVATATP